MMMGYDTQMLLSLLRTRQCGHNIILHDELESTNSTARELARANAPGGTLVLCEKQTAGRGRKQRRWESNPGDSVCMSLLLRPQIEPQYAPRLTLAVALGIYRAIKTLYNTEDVRIKWPNDIVFNGRKLVGILSESSITSSGVDYVVIGIGINVNNADFPDDIADIATSLRLIRGEAAAREPLIAAILNETEPLIPLCSTDLGFSSLMSAYTMASAVYNKPVRIIRINGDVEGVAVGFDSLGRIRIMQKDGSVQAFDSGDVSLRVRRDTAIGSQGCLPKAVLCLKPVRCSRISKSCRIGFYKKQAQPRLLLTPSE